MPLVAPAYLYCTVGDTEAILSVDGVALRLDDTTFGAPTAAERAYLSDIIIPWATSRVNIYLLGRYGAVQLSESYVANDCTAIIATRRLCQRRGNPVPETIMELYKEVMELLVAIKANTLSLEDVPERTSGSIAWSNVHHSRHTLRRNRVQRPISEQTTPVRSESSPDLLADRVGPEMYWLP